MANVTSSKVVEKRTTDWLLEGYVEFTVDESTLTAAAVTEALTINGFPANAIPLRAKINIGEYFTGGTVSAMTVQVGDSGDPNGKLTALNVFDTTTLGSFTGTQGVESQWTGVAANVGAKEESAYAPEILFTATGDNVVNCDAGFLTGRIYYQRYEDK